MFNKESFDHILYRNMALFISSCWYYLTICVFCLIKFIARHVFRIKMEDRSQEAKKDYSVPLQPVQEANEIEERDFNGFGEEEEEEEPSSFSFKFEYQIPKVSILSNEEPSVPAAEEKYQAKTTNISNYHFLSEKDFTGFVEEPEAVSFLVHESFVDSREEKLESKFSSEKDISGFAKELEAVNLRVYEYFVDNIEENLESRFLSEKGFSGVVEETEAVSFQVHESFVDSGVEKFESKSLSEKDFSGFIEEPEAVAFQIHESFVDSREEKLESKSLSVSVSISAQQSALEKDFSGFIEEPEAVNFQIHESFVDSREEKLESKSLSVSVSVSAQQSALEKNFSGFIEEPGAVPFQVHESFVDSIKEKLESKFFSAGDFEKPSIQSQDVVFLKEQKLEGKRPIGFEMNASGGKEVIETFSDFDSDSDSISLSDGYSVKKLIVDSESDDILSERDFGDQVSLIDSSTFDMELMGDVEKLEEGQSSNSSAGFSAKISEEKLHEIQSLGAENLSPFTDKLSQLDEIWSENDSLEAELELKELNVGEFKGTQLPSSSNLQIEFMDSSDDELPYSRNDSNNFNNSNLAESGLMHTNFDLDAEFSSSNGDHQNQNHSSNQVDEVLGRDTEGCEKRTTEEKLEDTQFKDLDAEDLNDLESLWEHQDLIEQLKMELKRARAIGLPTIFEESESPKTIDDLKPWKIDEKFLRENPMDELHKFYKSYRERMRKFDILNYQKMYAIGFLQLKNPLESMWTQKPLFPTIISHLSQNLRPPYRRTSSTDPSEKFMKEIQVDLETVYVGQTCLSWEFLCWQYEKARELPDSDPYRSHQYNQVAGEFQQFQVIVQRFIENESFQGPRLQNYVKNRCILRNLLQVPVIKEDCLKDKKEERNKGNYAITSEMLEEIMEESIRVFWEFVKADKDETSVIIKNLIRSQVELQDPADFKLMSEIQASLQKNDKKLKDILKTGNCLVKKFKKPRENRSNQDLFFSQVDMKLVSRVLKMSRITSDQLVWCHKKLSKITFANRKIHREPSFLLFPC